MKTADWITLCGGTALLAAVAIGTARLAALSHDQRASITPRLSVAVTAESGAATLAISGAPSRGRADAPLTLVELSDFECPSSGRYSRDVFDRIQHEYVDSGKVRYVFRNFPLPRHPHALEAAEAAHCANEQDRFWELRAILFANQQALEEKDLAQHAMAAGVDARAFARCLRGETKASVRQERDEAARAGVTGTPTFLLGVVDNEQRLRVLRQLSDVQSYAEIKAALDALLAH
jgi:protein-disulfide isomerase